MSYICTGNEVSSLPVICHCHVVTGMGRRICAEGRGCVDRVVRGRDGGGRVGVVVGDVGRLGDDELGGFVEDGGLDAGGAELGAAWCFDDEHPAASRVTESRPSK